jgi:hypothetical protein
MQLVVGAMQFNTISCVLTTILLRHFNDPYPLLYSTLCLTESGHQDKECGVHALLFVIIYVPDECIVLLIWAAAA